MHFGKCRLLKKILVMWFLVWWFSSKSTWAMGGLAHTHTHTFLSCSRISEGLAAELCEVARAHTHTHTVIHTQHIFVWALASSRVGGCVGCWGSWDERQRGIRASEGRGTGVCSQEVVALLQTSCCLDSQPCLCNPPCMCVCVWFHRRDLPCRSDSVSPSLPRG